MTTQSLKELAQKSLQSNKEHQYALKVYTERLQAELQLVDKLLSTAEIDEDEPQLETGGSIVIPGSKKAAGLVSSAELTAEGSPFYEDAMRRQRYVDLTETHPMKPKELEALAEAVRMENYRLYAYEAQRRGMQPFLMTQDQPKQLEFNTEGLDWDRISMKVTSTSTSVGRSAKECEIRWLGDRHPQFNHTQWTIAEITQVRTLVADIPEGQVDWVDISRRLGTNRTPIDCMRHAITRKTHVWDDKSDARLLEAVKVYGTENWSLVARTVSEDATPTQCSHRYFRSLDPSLKKGSWSAEEDAKLRTAVELYGHAWVEVASLIPGRTNEQCRDRWSERLNPSVSKGKWTEEEDKRLVSIVEQILRAGDVRWKEVSEKMGSGRTDNMCRHRYDTLRKRVDRGSASITPASSVSQTPAPDVAGPSTSLVGARIPARSTAKTRETLEGLSSHSTSDGTAPTAVTSTKPKPRPRPRKKVPATESVQQDSTRSGSEAILDAAIASNPPSPPKSRPRPRLVKKAATAAPGASTTPKRRSKRKAAEIPTSEPEFESEDTQSDAAVAEAEAAASVGTRTRKGKGKAKAKSVSKPPADNSAANARKRKAPAKRTRHTAPEEPEVLHPENEDEETDLTKSVATASKPSPKRKSVAKKPSATPTRRQPRRSVNVSRSTGGTSATQDAEDVEMRDATPNENGASELSELSSLNAE